LSWQSISAKIFNVGVYRRADTPQPTAEFFNTGNKEGERLRKQAAEAAVNDMIDWFKNRGGTIGILDATNSTRSRRKWVYEKCQQEGIDCLFIESLCNDEKLIMSNILEVKTTSPDYVGQDPEMAALDFRNRIRNYEKVYQTVGENGEDEYSYVKIIDVSAQTVINRIKNYLQSRIVYYCITLHIKPRSVWISRVRLNIYLCLLIR
jgi:6-phosphofructo-2-kinase/fructose-2,6-biphosphatase 2